MTTRYHDYGPLKDRAERYARMVRDRAEKHSRLAGLGNLGCQLHNSLVSRDYGKPWRGVDYHHARKAQWLLRKQHDAHRLLDKLYRRGRVACQGAVFVRGKGLVAVETY